MPLYLEEVAIMATDAMWPGPMAGAAGTEDYNAAGNSDFSRKAMEQAEALIERLNWAGPQARDHFPAHSEEYIAAKKAQGHGMRNLNDEAANWAAPAARDYKGSSEGSMFRQDGKSRADLLDCQAEQFFHPPSSPDRPIIAAGSTSSTDSPNSNQPSVKRKLNPIFVEALMRWPTGLSGFERQEMAWTLWWQQQRSFLSDLASPVIDQHAQMEMF